MRFSFVAIILKFFLSSNSGNAILRGASSSASSPSNVDYADIEPSIGSNFTKFFGQGDRALEANEVYIQLVVLGSMTWGFYDAVQQSYPNEAADVTNAMNEAINNYNTVASYSDHVPVTYVTWGGVTAQANWGGSIQFGYMRSGRTAMHETSHFMGMYAWANGAKGWWRDLCNGGWQGSIGKARMQSFKPGEGIGCSQDSGHFWDYGLNQEGEYHWLSRGRNVAMVGAMRADIGLSDGCH